MAGISPFQPSKSEQKLLNWIDHHFTQLAMAALFMLSVLIRIALRDGTNGDLSTKLVPWYEEIKSAGGLRALDHQVGDYNMFYQFILALLTYLPMKPAYAIKLSSCLFDYLLAAGIGKLTFELAGQKKHAQIAFFIVLFSPLVLLNSAWWAQCDAMYVSLCIWALVLFLKEKYLPAFAVYGFAYAFKLQAIFLLPLFLFLWVYQKRYSIINFLLIPIMMMLSALPCVFAGRGKKSIFQVISFYLFEAGIWQKMYLNYPSFWCLMGSHNTEEYFQVASHAAVLLTVVVLAALMLFWKVRNVTVTPRATLYMAFLLSYTCVLFLPAMHERYAFLPELLGIVIAILVPKTIPFLIGMNLISFATYGSFLIANAPSPYLYPLAIANTILYVCYMASLNHELVISS